MVEKDLCSQLNTLMLKVQYLSASNFHASLSLYIYIYTVSLVLFSYLEFLVLSIVGTDMDFASLLVCMDCACLLACNRFPYIYFLPSFYFVRGMKC
jgi:hypothetical protein